MDDRVSATRDIAKNVLGWTVQQNITMEQAAGASIIADLDLARGGASDEKMESTTINGQQLSA
jgi:hypothetical protein